MARNPKSAVHDTVKRRVSLMFIVGICLILTFNTASLSIYMRRTALQTTVDYEMTVVDTLANHIEDMNATAQSLLLQLYNNRNVREITTYDSLSDVELLSLRSQLSDYYFQTPYMYSYYLINTSLKRVCTHTNLYSFESFTDQELLEMIRCPDNIQPFRANVRHNVPTAESSVPTNYFTFFQFETYRNVTPTAFIVVNISEEWIQEKINDVCHNDEQVLIFDENGKIVLTGQAVSSLQEEDFSDIYRQLPADASSFTLKLHNISYTGLHAPANNGLWTIVRLLPTSSIYAQPNLRTLTAVAISLLVLAASITVYILSSKKVLSPVDDLITRLHNIELEQANAYPLLKEMVSDMIRQSGLKGNTRDLVALFQKYDIHIRLDQALMLCLCRVDQYHAFCELYDSRTRSSMQYAISNVSQDLLRPLCQVEGISAEPDTILLILSDFIDGLETDMDLVCDGLQRIQKCVLENLGFRFSCALSDIGTFSDFRSQYTQVYDLIQQRFYTGPGSVILPDDMTSTAVSPALPVWQSLQQLSERLALKDYTGGEKLVQNALQVLRNGPVSGILQFVSRVNGVIQEYSFSESESAQNLYSHTARVDMLKMVDHAENYDEVCEAYHKLFTQLEAFSSGEKESGGTYLQLVSEVKQAIEEQYTDPNLSLQSLADHFPFSSVYLGRIFRRIVGCSVAVYINTVRLQHAARLLVETNLPVNEIAAACGMENPSYLYTLFKKQYNMTPGEYKRLHTGETHINQSQP